MVGTAGHRAALRDREPAAGRPVVVRRAALGRPRPGDSRRGLRRDDAGAGAEPRAGEEGQDLPRDELRHESLRLRRAGDRQQRRPERRPPRSHGARLPGGRLGRHHPALRRTWTRRQAPDLPGLQLDRGRAGDLRERLRAARCRRSPSQVVPILECVEELDGGSSSPTGATRTRTAPPSSAPGDQNTFSPAPPNRGQPTAFAAGRVEDAFQVEFDGSELTWSLTGNKASASRNSKKCPGGSITITKRLVPKTTPAASRCGSTARSRGGAAAVGDGGSTGTIAVATGSRTVSETAAPGTKLGDYTIETVCRNGDRVVASSDESSVKVAVGRGDAIVCTITNNAEPDGPGVTPTLDCVLFKDGADDVAYWGYRNGSVRRGDDRGRKPVEPLRARQARPRSARRRSSPAPTPASSRPRSRPATATLTWTLSESTRDGERRLPGLQPDARAPQGHVPGRRPGQFQLRDQQRGRRRGRQRDDDRSPPDRDRRGHRQRDRSPGTSLADYDSRVECTRNGKVEMSPRRARRSTARWAGGDLVVCTFTNTRKGTPTRRPPNPPNPPTHRPAQPARRTRRRCRRLRPARRRSSTSP